MNRHHVAVLAASTAISLSGAIMAARQVPDSSPNQTVNVLNHIIFLAQENRSLDHYFGAMRSYWKTHGFTDQSFDGLPNSIPRQASPRSTGRRPRIPVAIRRFLRPATARKTAPARRLFPIT